MSTYLHSIVYSFFHTAMAELSERDYTVHRAKNIYYLPFYKTLYYKPHLKNQLWFCWSPI